MWTVALRVDMAKLSWCGPVEGRGEERKLWDMGERPSETLHCLNGTCKRDGKKSSFLWQRHC